MVCDGRTFVAGSSELQPLAPQHYRELYQLEFGAPFFGTVRHGGRTLNPDEYVASLYSAAEITYVLVTHGQVRGLMSAYGFEPEHGTTKLAAVLSGRRTFPEALLMGRSSSSSSPLSPFGSS